MFELGILAGLMLGIVIRQWALPALVHRQHRLQ